MIATRPSQKYGTDEKNVVTGRRPSAHDPTHPAVSAVSAAP